MKKISITLAMLNLAVGMSFAQIDSRTGVSGPAQQIDSQQPADTNTDQVSTIAGVHDFFATLPREGLTFDAQLSEVADSHPLLAGAHAGWDEISRANGTIDYRHSLARSTFLLQYLGGYDYYAQQTQLSAPHHDVALNEMFSVGRWDFLLGGQFTYLPQAYFGFNSTQFLQGSGAGLVSQSGNQSVLTWQKSTRIGNTEDAQADYRLTARSTLSFSGSYFQLHFLNGSGLQNDNSIQATVSFDHSFSPFTAVGFAHNYQELVYPGTGLRIRSQNPSLVAQRAFNRLKLKGSVGPQFRTYQGIVPSPGVDVSFGATAGVQYSVRTTLFETSYSHRLLSGSGFLPGAQGDIASLIIMHPIGQSWSFDVNTQYARNSTLAATKVNGRQVINAEVVSLQLTHIVGDRASVFLGYNYRTQDTSSPLCVAGNCSTFPDSHQLSIGLSFGSQKTGQQ